MEEFNQLFLKADKNEVQKFYKNMKKMVGTRRNKKNYSQNLVNVLNIYSKLNNSPLNSRITAEEMNKHFTLRDYQDIFTDFRQTLMGARTMEHKTSNLFDLGQKSNALKRYFMEYENITNTAPLNTDGIEVPIMKPDLAPKFLPDGDKIMASMTEDDDKKEQDFHKQNDDIRKQNIDTIMIKANTFFEGTARTNRTRAPTPSRGLKAVKIARGRGRGRGRGGGVGGGL